MAIPYYIIPYAEEAYLGDDSLVYVEGVVLNGFISENVSTTTFNTKTIDKPSFSSTNTSVGTINVKDISKQTFTSTNTSSSTFGPKEIHKPTFTSTNTSSSTFNIKTIDKSSFSSTNVSSGSFGQIERMTGSFTSTGSSSSTFTRIEIGLSRIETNDIAAISFQTKSLEKSSFTSSNNNVSTISLLTVDPDDPAFLSLDVMSSNANPATPDKAYSLDGDIPPPELKRLPAFSETTNMNLTFQLNVTQPVQPLQINNIVVSPAIEGITVQQTGNNQITVSGKPKIKTQTEVGLVDVVGGTIDGNIDDVSKTHGYSLYDFDGDERQFIELSITVNHNWGTVVTKMSINNDWEANRLKALEMV